MAQITPFISSPDELPPLREHYGEFKAFGWDYEFKDIVKWAEEHGHPNEDYINSCTILGNNLPESHVRITRVRDDDGAIFRMCLVIATNRSLLDRQRALDKELIESYRAVHGWDKPPRWFDHVSSSDL
ncbi:hypothetical protein E4T56_gene788 [Termitomyces sp. T112]|nr:hypothetical protein E4T56_gene788 [Termitomyces sp. T112]KAH0578891.1 hypothetical protein H2248_003083 [Termitomyces sp. 'cryptogamus']KNZ76286.1 hypothetical protein J132_10960 [Termitomyces sp. J132]